MKATRPAAPRVDTSRTYTPSATVHGRHVERGAELTVTGVRGVRGRVVFLAHVRHVDGAEWLDVKTSTGVVRAVRPDAVRTVHRTRRTGIDRAAS